MKTLTIIAMTIFLFGCPSSGDRNPLGPSPIEPPPPVEEEEKEDDEEESFAQSCNRLLDRSFSFDRTIDAGCKKFCPVHLIVPKLRDTERYKLAARAKWRTQCILPDHPKISNDDKTTREIHCNWYFRIAPVRELIERVPSVGYYKYCDE